MFMADSMIQNFKNLPSGCIVQQTERADVQNEGTEEFLAGIKNLLRRVAESPEQVRRNYIPV